MRIGALFKQLGVLTLMLCSFAARAPADDAAPAPDKSAYDLFNPTPDALMRSFSTDRPPKANSPYTVDAGHFQYETDIAVFDYSDAGGVRRSFGGGAGSRCPSCSR